jgi:hypothetical protein
MAERQSHKVGNMGSKTGKRYQIQHRYHDHSQDISLDTYDCGDVSSTVAPKRFPSTLHLMLQNVEEEGLAFIISWKAHGRAFKIHKAPELKEKILCKYFNHTKISSFHRQLNLYGFSRITQGCDKGAYYHELFLRGKANLASQISRQKVKGAARKGMANPESEPDFYSMPFITIDVHSSTLMDHESEPQSNIIMHDDKAKADVFQLQLVDFNNNCFLDDGAFDLHSFDSDAGDISSMILDFSSTDPFIKDTAYFCGHRTAEYFLEDEPDSIHLECSDVVQHYSLEECRLFYSLCQQIDAELI